MARLAILTLFMGQTRNRFLQYQEPRTILEILDMAGRTEGCEGVELRYPGDLADPKAVKAALERNNLGIALAEKGQLDAAINQVQEALRLKPDFAEARKNLEQLQLHRQGQPLQGQKGAQ